MGWSALADIPAGAIAAGPPDLPRQWRAEADAVWSFEYFPRNDGEVARRERSIVLRECAGEHETVVARLMFAARAAAGDRIIELQQAAVADRGRIRDLQLVAAEILIRFTADHSGYRARATDAQLTRWRTVLQGDQP
jgi:hypothetical protein